MQQAKKGDVVFITGATGRLGRAMAKALVAEGCTVRALMVNKEEITLLPTGTIPFIGTLGDAKVMDEACKGTDIVFHFAGMVHAAKSTAEQIMRTNVEGTKVVLDACVKNKVKHLIFTSTIDVYGKKRKGSLTEESQLMPSDKYGHSKMIAEQDIMRSGVPYTILRVSTIYGHGFEHSFFKVFRALHENKMVIIGRGDNHMSLVHVDDVVRAMMLVKNNPEASTNKVYNLSDGVVYTQEGLVDIAADMMKVGRPTRHAQEFVVKMLARARNLDSDELRFLTSDRVIDISSIRKDLGFSPEVDIKTGGKAMVDKFLNKMMAK